MSAENENSVPTVPSQGIAYNVLRPQQLPYWKNKTFLIPNINRSY